MVGAFEESLPGWTFHTCYYWEDRELRYPTGLLDRDISVLATATLSRQAPGEADLRLINAALLPLPPGPPEQGLCAAEGLQGCRGISDGMGRVLSVK